MSIETFIMYILYYTVHCYRDPRVLYNVMYCMYGDYRDLHDVWCVCMESIETFMMYGVYGEYRDLHDGTRCGWMSCGRDS